MQYNEFTDETLVSLTLLGDNTAFETLVLRHRKAVNASAYSITRDVHMAEDIMQDTFVSAWVRLNTLRESGKFAPWACNIARNKAKTLVVRRKEEVSFGREHWSAGDNIEDLIFPENNEQLQASLESLSDPLRDVIRLHYYEDASIEEIGARLNIPAGTVKRRLHDGRKKIRKDLGHMENSTDIIAKSILDKIENIRGWHRKEIFETDYKDTLAAIDKMKETAEKYYYMAEVMEKGYRKGHWWLPEKTNEDITNKIEETALKGKNYTVLDTAWRREIKNSIGEPDFENMRGYRAREREYLQNTMIPQASEANIPDKLAWAWLQLGNEFYRMGDIEAGDMACGKTMEILPKHHQWYASAMSDIRFQRLLEGRDVSRLTVVSGVQSLRNQNGKLTTQPSHVFKAGREGGSFFTSFWLTSDITRCKGVFFDSSLKVGESIKCRESWGVVSLTYAAANAKIETSCGLFENCALWVTEAIYGKWSAYYKPGIGLVYIEVDDAKGKSIYSLKKYHIARGENQLFPLYEGNAWEYDTGHNPKLEIDVCKMEVVSGNGTDANLVCEIIIYRKES